MKKILSLACIALGVMFNYARGQTPLDFGTVQANGGIGFAAWGIPLYGGVEVGMSRSIAVGARASYQRAQSTTRGGTVYDHGILVVGVNSNYYFDQFLSLPPRFDVYAGLSIAYYFWHDAIFVPGGRSGLGIDLQAGGRYFLNSHLALNSEINGGSGGQLLVGVTWRLRSVDLR